MRPRLPRRQVPKSRFDPPWSGAPRAGNGFRSAIESGVLAGLLIAIVTSTVIRAPTMLLCAVVGAWPVLAAIVGPRNVLDAGCAFMLLVVGVVLVVDLATNGPASLLP